MQIEIRRPKEPNRPSEKIINSQVFRQIVDMVRHYGPGSWIPGAIHGQKRGESVTLLLLLLLLILHSRANYTEYYIISVGVRPKW